jgi:signal transduction histidine kinase
VGAVLGERVYSWARGHGPLVDAATALALTAGCLALGPVVRAGPDYLVFSSMLLLPLGWRRSRPVPVAALVLLVALAQWLVMHGGTGALPADVAVPLVIHACAAYGSPWSGRAALAGGLLGAVLGGLSWPQLPVGVPAHVLTGAFLASTVAAAWAFGVAHRVRHLQVIMLAERARLRERTRIARELHDIVAHSLAVLIAQADGGRYAPSPDAARTALGTIADHARQALAETRRALGVLRDGPLGDPVPQPGIGDVPALVDRVRAGGLDVRLAAPPPPVVLEPGLGLAAYRIVQEGLTNVIKHAGPTARAEVSVRCTGGRLEIDVRDDGRGPLAAPVGGGYGVLGMRERAGAYGGTVTLRQAAGGGRILHARIPLPS